MWVKEIMRDGKKKKLRKSFLKKKIFKKKFKFDYVVNLRILYCDLIVVKLSIDFNY